jgi:hypothetical protein
MTIDLWSWVFPSESEAFQVRVAHCFMYCTLATVFYFGGGREIAAREALGDSRFSSDGSIHEASTWETSHCGSSATALAQRMGQQGILSR